MRSIKSKRLLLAGIVVLLLVLATGGGLLYEGSPGASCARCHEIRPSYEMWANSAHRSTPCEDCHGGVLTLDAGFHVNNLRRLVQHVRDEVPQQIAVTSHGDIEKITLRCRQCHQQEYAAWQAGAHSTTYTEIFLDEEHNGKRLLTDDCLRCHGMHFQGSIEDLVSPVDTEGPWKLLVPELGEQPAMPCVACHQIHREGEPLGPRVAEQAPAAATQEIFRPSLALFDRRTRIHLAAGGMPLPEILDGEQPVKMSPDQRQALCYQCHAPLATAQVGSGDDRTGIGVHEGLSCLGCHDKHSQNTRASCSNCHPRWSNCGLDVETMDTTFKNPDSPHNIHFVKCTGCHPEGAPRKPQTAD